VRLRDRLKILLLLHGDRLKILKAEKSEFLDVYQGAGLLFRYIRRQLFNEE